VNFENRTHLRVGLVEVVVGVGAGKDEDVGIPSPSRMSMNQLRCGLVIEFDEVDPNFLPARYLGLYVPATVPPDLPREA
jgi:hypothetical protein